MTDINKCKHRITKKSFQKLCKDKLDCLKLQLCRNEIEELVYELGICKDEKIDYVALHSFLSPTTVKRTLRRFYDRASNLPIDLFHTIFDT